MPFTPLHMGPGMALKSVAGRRFSVTAFGLTQVFMDIEPLLRILREDAFLHGPTHTYLGSLGVALIAWPVCWWVCPWIVRYWNAQLRAHRLAWLQEEARPSAVALTAGVVVGALSHVALDSIMHYDMAPFAPFYAGNPTLFVISVSALHWVCVVSGVISVLVWLAVALRNAAKARDN